MWVQDSGCAGKKITAVHSSVYPSVNSSVMSKFDIYVKVSILINYNSTTTIIPCMAHLPDLLTWQVHWPIFCASLTLTQFTLTFQIFSTIRCTTTKPCIVLLLDVLTRQVSWPGDILRASDFETHFASTFDISSTIRPTTIKPGHMWESQVLLTSDLFTVLYLCISGLAWAI